MRKRGIRGSRCMMDLDEADFFRDGDGDGEGEG